MCPAPLYSYFDAQQLADFIMTSQFPGYDGTNSTAATSDQTPSSLGHFSNIAATAAFSSSMDDYDSYDNARARKRRMTVAEDGRRSDEVAGFSLPDTSDALFDMLYQHSSSSSSNSNSNSNNQPQQQQHHHHQNSQMIPASSLSSLPIPPSLEDQSVNAALATGLFINGISFPQSQHHADGSSDAQSQQQQQQQQQQILSSPVVPSKLSSRRPPSLRVSVSRPANNESSAPNPETPAMFSPSFMDAVEGAAAAAGMTSPSTFYTVASPYPNEHSHHHNHHHHSFSMPSATMHPGSSHEGHSIFSSGTSVNPPAGTGASDDFSSGLHISMDASIAAAVAATMRGSSSLDDASSGTNTSGTSAFSRVQSSSGDMAHLLGGSSVAQQPELNFDIGASLASFASIPGLDAFPSGPLDPHGNPFVNSAAGADCGPFGALSSEPSLFHSMGPSADHSGARYVSSAGTAPLNIPGVVMPDASNPMASPAVGSSAGLHSPTIPVRRSRKRAATSASIRSENLQQQTAALIPVNLQGMATINTASSSNGGGSSSLVAAPSAVALASNGPVFNSQAVVAGTGSKIAMVLTSKVAQKSYGTEKRFLCPPPTVLLFGEDWQLPSFGPGDSTSLLDAASHSGSFTALMPRISVTVPTNDVPSTSSSIDSGVAGLASDTRSAQLEWLAQPDPTPKPESHVPHNPEPAPRSPREGEPVTGRFVAKQLFINDVDEKRKKVSVKVRLHDPTGQVVLNEFESKPIKVISKPSKKRQSVKNVDLCIHHGSTISLFNRLRSQTVSTKYLGATRSMSVGGPRPFWFPGGGDESAEPPCPPGQKPKKHGAATTFVARNSIWDPFIIWIVNTKLTKEEIDAFNARIAENPTPIPGYPTPPTFAMHPHCPPDLEGGTGGSSDDGQFDADAMGQPQPKAPIPILYNQPVILQCVSTGMCSPVLTLRKIEKGSVAVGSYYGSDRMRDVQGDPVSQLHKVAFEVRIQSPEELPAVTVTPAGLHPHVGSYLTCMEDVVGIHATCDGRQTTEDGSAASGKGGSAGGSQAGQGRKQSKDGASAGTTSWTEDVGDSAVWTIVGTDCAIYRFDYPSPTDMLPKVHQANSSVNNLSSSPADAIAGSVASTAAPTMHASLALPPTPTSPHGMHDCSRHSHHPPSHVDLDMIMKDTSASAAAAAAAIYGLSMPSVTSGVQAHHPISSQAISAGLISTMGLANSAGGLQQQQHMHTPSPAENLIPVVFKASAHHPPTISPSALGGCALDGTSDGHAAMTERSYITLQGTNFAPDMVVLFDGLPSMYTEFKSPETIVCLGPLPSDLASNIAAAHQRALEGDEGYGGIYAGDKQQQQQHPCSPTASSEDGSSVVASEAETPRTQRASSTDSTASSATATQETACKGAGKHGIAKSAGKNKKHLTKIPIYLSRNGGAGPTYKTGQVFTLHC